MYEKKIHFGYTQHNGNKAGQFSALRVGAKGHQARVSMSSLSVPPRFPSSKAAPFKRVRTNAVPMKGFRKSCKLRECTIPSRWIAIRRDEACVRAGGAPGDVICLRRPAPCFGAGVPGRHLNTAPTPPPRLPTTCRRQLSTHVPSELLFYSPSHESNRKGVQSCDAKLSGSFETEACEKLYYCDWTAHTQHRKFSFSKSQKNNLGNSARRNKDSVNDRNRALERETVSLPTYPHWRPGFNLTAGFSHVGIVPDGDLVGYSPFPSPLHSGAAPYTPQSPSSALKTSLKDAQIDIQHIYTRANTDFTDNILPGTILAFVAKKHERATDDSATHIKCTLAGDLKNSRIHFGTSWDSKHVRLYNLRPLVHTVFDTTWRTVTQSSPSTVTADNQCAVGIGIFVHKTVDYTLQYGIRFVFHCKSAIGVESSKVSLINSDQIAKCVKRFGRLLTAKSREPMRVIEVKMERRRNEGAREKGDPEKTSRPTTSSGTIPLLAKKASCRIAIVRPRNSKAKGIRRRSVFCIYGLNSVFRHYGLPFLYTLYISVKHSVNIRKFLTHLRNPVTRSGIEPGSAWWETSVIPLRNDQFVGRASNSSVGESRISKTLCIAVQPPQTSQLTRRHDERSFKVDDHTSTRARGGQEITVSQSQSHAGNHDRAIVTANVGGKRKISASREYNSAHIRPLHNHPGLRVNVNYRLCSRASPAHRQKCALRDLIGGPDKNWPTRRRLQAAASTRCFGKTLTRSTNETGEQKKKFSLRRAFTTAPDRFLSVSRYSDVARKDEQVRLEQSSLERGANWRLPLPITSSLQANPLLLPPNKSSPYKSGATHRIRTLFTSAEDRGVWRRRCSPATKANRVQSPAGLPDFREWNSRYRWPAGFLGDLPFPPPLHSGAAPYSPQSPSSALETSLLRAAQISSHSLKPPPQAGPVFMGRSRYGLSPVNIRLAISLGHQNKVTTFLMDYLIWRGFETVLAEKRAKAVHDKVSTFDINLTKKSLLLPAYILTDALSDMRRVKLVTMDGNGKYAYFHDVIYYEQTAKIVSYLILISHFETKIDESEIQNHEISLMQHFYIGTKIKLDPGSELGSFDLGSGKMLVQPGIIAAQSIRKTELINCAEWLQATRTGSRRQNSEPRIPVLVVIDLATLKFNVRSLQMFKMSAISNMTSATLCNRIPHNTVKWIFKIFLCSLHRNVVITPSSEITRSDGNTTCQLCCSPAAYLAFELCCSMSGVFDKIIGRVPIMFTYENITYPRRGPNVYVHGIQSSGEDTRCCPTHMAARDDPAKRTASEMSTAALANDIAVSARRPVPVVTRVHGNTEENRDGGELHDDWKKVGENSNEGEGETTTHVADHTPSLLPRSRDSRAARGGQSSQRARKKLWYESALTHSSLQSSGFTPSRPFTPRAPRPPSSRDLPSSSVLFNDVLQRPRPFPEYSCATSTLVGFSSRGRRRGCDVSQVSPLLRGKAARQRAGLPGGGKGREVASSPRNAYTTSRCNKMAVGIYGGRAEEYSKQRRARGVTSGRGVLATMDPQTSDDHTLRGSSTCVRAIRACNLHTTSHTHTHNGANVPIIHSRLLHTFLKPCLSSTSRLFLRLVQTKLNKSGELQQRDNAPHSCSLSLIMPVAKLNVHTEEGYNAIRKVEPKKDFLKCSHQSAVVVPGFMICEINHAAIDSHCVISTTILSVYSISSLFCVFARWGETRDPEKTRQPAASSGTIPTCGNPGVTRPGIEPGSPWWEASMLTAQSLRSLRKHRVMATPICEKFKNSTATAKKNRSRPIRMNTLFALINTHSHTSASSANALQDLGSNVDVISAHIAAAVFKCIGLSAATVEGDNWASLLQEVPNTVGGRWFKLSKHTCLLTIAKLNTSANLKTSTAAYAETSGVTSRSATEASETKNPRCSSQSFRLKPRLIIGEVLCALNLPAQDRDSNPGPRCAKSPGVSVRNVVWLFSIPRVPFVSGLAPVFCGLRCVIHNQVVSMHAGSNWAEESTLQKETKFVCTHVLGSMVPKVCTHINESAAGSRYATVCVQRVVDTDVEAHFAATRGCPAGHQVRSTWFMHDGTQQHSSTVARAYLGERFLHGWVVQDQSPGLHVPLILIHWIKPLGTSKDHRKRNTFTDSVMLRQRVEQDYQQIYDIHGVFERVKTVTDATCIRIQGRLMVTVHRQGCSDADSCGGRFVTLHPELVDARVHLGGLEADAEGGQHEDGDEEHLPRVALQEAAQLEELRLQPSTHPQRRATTARLALQQQPPPMVTGHGRKDTGHGRRSNGHGTRITVDIEGGTLDNE
ncbi:hypothetical protein PR048_026344 [Dryococelus australis]|uniref:Uncharacterized protein n=1 Tax=Dryococelus australis TaxID=614101 RepID=A0ABQ9GL18_9NEOP|nr:hypothetical protein PR048_026344 [Dryococelus australis]